MVVLTVAASLLIPAVPVSALSLGEFFSLSYTVDFSKTTVAANEQFSVTVTGTAVCTKDLTFPYDVVSEVKTTGRIVAYPQSGGSSVVLNSGYTLDIQPAPTKAGESAKDTQTLALKFPAGTPDGIYQITGELIRAQAKAVVWLDVTQYLPASKAMGTLTVAQAGSGGGGGGSESPTPTPTPFPEVIDLSKTNLANYLDAQGKALCKMLLQSADGACGIVVDKGTSIQFPAGSTHAITLQKADNPTSNSTNYRILGQVFQLGPAGTTFDPPLSLTFNFDPHALPAGVSARNLVVARWNESTAAWENLETTVNETASTITARISHFSLYGILARVPSAQFTLSGLTVNPQNALAGDKVTVKVVISNSGDLGGSYHAVLMAGDIEVTSQEVTLAAGEGRELIFTFSLSSPGEYILKIGGQSALLKVTSVNVPPVTQVTPPPSTSPRITPKPAAFVLSALKVDPSEVAFGTPVSVTVTVVNTGEEPGECQVALKLDDAAYQTGTVSLGANQQQNITFKIAKAPVGMHKVAVDGLSTGFKVTAAKNSPSLTLRIWLGALAVIVIAACILAGVLFSRRRK